MNEHGMSNKDIKNTLSTFNIFDMVINSGIFDSNIIYLHVCMAIDLTKALSD